MQYGHHISTSITDAFEGPPGTQEIIFRVVAVLAAALVLVVIFDALVARLTPKIARRAEHITTDSNVLRLRRAETIAGLWITVVRVIIVVGALLAVWNVSQPSSGPVALIGVGTVVIILASATIVPLLRDVTYGFIMIVEHWYNVGDHIVMEPFPGSGGVVEKMTLRSTKLRSVNGEAIWIHHQHIQAMRVTSAAAHPLVVETFVNDPVAGQKVVEEAMKIIPAGATTVPVPLSISEVKKVSDNIWRITAICEVTPFREWIIDKFAIDVITKTDQLTGNGPVIVHGPIVYYADATAEKRYRRSATVRKHVRSATKSQR
jgi:hypothetical protein